MEHRLEKIKTIGDAYLCVGGVPESNLSHPSDCIEAGFEILSFMEEWKAEQQAKKEGIWTLRRSGLQKVEQGITSLEELNRVTKD